MTAASLEHAASSGATIHSTAVVEDGARIGGGVRVGPFCHVGPDVTLHENVELLSHVSVMGATTIGAGTKIHPFAALGGQPQDTKHKGGRTTLTIGRNCNIREGVTMHAGSDGGRRATTVGDNGFFLAYSHVAHDCVVGDNVTITNGALLGGHCEIGDHVIIGGMTAVHQFTRVGRRAFLAGCSAIPGDVIPFGMATGNLAKLRGFNVIGLRRAGVQRAELMVMRDAYRRIFDPARPLAANIELAAAEFSDSPPVMEIVAFMRGRGKRYLVVPPHVDAGEPGDDADA